MMMTIIIIVINVEGVLEKNSKSTLSYISLFHK